MNKSCYTAYVIQNEKDEFGCHSIVFSTTYGTYDAAKQAAECYLVEHKLEDDCYVQVEETTDKYIAED